MNLETAIEAFKDIEHYKRGEELEDGTEVELAVFSVRLDAGVDRDDERSYRLRVSPGSWTFDGREDWAALMDTAKQYGLDVEVQNNGIELS